MSIITPTPIKERIPGPYPAARRCTEPDCITVLSRYSPGPKCCAHSEPATVSDREQREAWGELLAEIAAEEAA